MQTLEQRISQLMVTVITAVFVSRFVYYYSKAPELVKTSHPGFATTSIELSSWDRINWAWNKANTGRN